VQAERDALATVVEELNHGIAGDHGVRLELARWEMGGKPMQYRGLAGRNCSFGAS
jgi:hypothetical protein